MQTRLFEQATKLMQRKNPDVQRAAGMFERAWKGGDYRAAYALATWHLSGHYFEKDASKAVKLLKQAAKARVADAMYDLAICYERGAGVKKNTRQALALYLDAALLYATEKKGELRMYSFDEAAHSVARCYYHGIGVAKDPKVSKVWRSYSSK
jgi:uncharacterized protein